MFDKRQVSSYVIILQKSCVPEGILVGHPRPESGRKSSTLFLRPITNFNTRKRPRGSGRPFVNKTGTSQNRLKIIVFYLRSEKFGYSTTTIYIMYILCLCLPQQYLRLKNDIIVFFVERNRTRLVALGASRTSAFRSFMFFLTISPDVHNCSKAHTTKYTNGPSKVNVLKRKRTGPKISSQTQEFRSGFSPRARQVNRFSPRQFPRAAWSLPTRSRQRRRSVTITVETVA